MTVLSPQISFSAGSESLDSNKFRIIEEQASDRLEGIVKLFPELKQFLGDSSLIVSAYPAALGLKGYAPLVDTYLHLPHLIRAFRLAAQENRNVFFVAQPLAGAELLFQCAKNGQCLPQRMLFASGGYYFPSSLERFLKQFALDRGCRIEFLYSYGAAEIGHTCFAATSRGNDNTPDYRQIAKQLEIEVDEHSGEMCLGNRNGKRVRTGDFASVEHGIWKIKPGDSRISSSVLNELERWTDSDWTRKTGYLNKSDNGLEYQLRRDNRVSAKNNEIEYYEFTRTYGCSLLDKPRWS